ncbi:hypothetical protein J2Z32_004437 [Paenibacillus turicensis]|uniref:Restriction endonuclease subunit S n=1 Tax=Paenibacillus turicensis TaxID=160487 RepID=A0ABS4FYT8_9BACL|nr:restriction endonuclease subunit S [Paenibacillus turicensis]MBP1907756.1 hypothetical protein [Paenibacillus turicensis]
MSREQSFLKMLEATANIQWNISMILEAKAVEAEKLRNWVLNHVVEESFADHEKQLSHPLDVHEQLIEVIEGLTKLQSGFSSNLKTILPEEDDGEDGGGFGDMFGGMDYEGSDK